MRNFTQSTKHERHNLKLLNNSTQFQANQIRSKMQQYYYRLNSASCTHTHPAVCHEYAIVYRKIRSKEPKKHCTTAQTRMAYHTMWQEGSNCSMGCSYYVCVCLTLVSSSNFDTCTTSNKSKNERKKYREEKKKLFYLRNIFPAIYSSHQNQAMQNIHMCVVYYDIFGVYQMDSPSLSFCLCLSLSYNITVDFTCVLVTAIFTTKST